MMEDTSKRDFANAPVVWKPKEDSGKLTKQFMKKIQDKYNVNISDFWDLHKWSVENVGNFWEEIWHLSGIIYSKPYHQVIDPNTPMGEFHEWFAGAQMNYAENLLRYRDDHVALVVAGEDKETEYVTYAEVYENARLYAAALRKQGVKKGTIVSCSTEGSGTVLVPDKTLSLYKCEIPTASLGIKCQCVDDSGEPLLGSVGDLVFTVPIPHLPLGILGDNDRSVYKEKYCEKHPGKFYSGDFAIINPITKGFILCGRSDETLNPGGCRFGSSEIYDIVDTFPEIEDSICVSQYSKRKVERAVLFLKMKCGHDFSDSLVERLRKAISEELSVRHVPEVILEVKDIPRNMNYKKMESIVKRIINKMPYDSLTVVNPECLKNYIDLPELSGF